MIHAHDSVFALETAHTSYLFRILDTSHLEHLYYGAKIACTPDTLPALENKCSNPNGCSVCYDNAHPNLCLDDVCLEVSGNGKGDFRQPAVSLTFADGSTTTDFLYQGHAIFEGALPLATLPSAYDETETAQTLVITLKEAVSPVNLELKYTVFPASDCIVRSATLVNCGTESLVINRLMSAQLDLDDAGYRLTSFHGDWTREMAKHEVLLSGGQFVSSSNTGNSSNHANPFVMAAQPTCQETSGECFAFNLLYSGNHWESADVSGHGKTRILTGINPDTLRWNLAPDERFEAPEAVLTFSGKGYRGISQQMHAFVRQHIVRGVWKEKERPVLLNSWEAFYFNFNEKKLLKLAESGKKAGIELFVLDDGWFGERNDDTSSLGDWTVNEKKLPGGLGQLSQKIEAMGMQFGIWVEPEMVNEDSDLYRAHPDWAVRVPNRPHATGRNQMLLDFTRSDVRENIVAQMSAVFSSGNISYVKWDMNRNFSDVYSSALGADQQGEFAHRYILGLYEVVQALTERFPNILFEGCASGGNRFDLGMLCYMPQIWASDNTDAISRLSIQEGLSYGYPQSVVGAHVSACPNHQTLRTTPLETRFCVAAFGVLGYECNLAELSAEDFAQIQEQIQQYKLFRNVLQFGDFYRLASGNRTKWIAVSPDKTTAVGMMVQKLVVANSPHATFRATGLDDTLTYHFSNTPRKINIKRFGDLVNTISPIHIKQESLLHNVAAHFVKMDGEQESFTVSGSLLNHAGIRLAQSFAGTGYNPNTRLFQDFDSRLYFIQAVDTCTE